MDIKEARRHAGTEVLLKVFLTTTFLEGDFVAVVDYGGTKFYADIKDLSSKDTKGEA